MSNAHARGFERREFLKLAGAAGLSGLAPVAHAAESRHVQLWLADERMAASAPVARATEKLRTALKARGVSSETVRSAQQVRGGAACVVVGGADSHSIAGFGPSQALKEPESLRLLPGKVAGVPAVLASGADARGCAYALLELAERVATGHDPVESLALRQTIEESAANPVRSVSRLFCSELEDKPWLYDKAFWAGYLDRLMASRFNRFTLALGLAYDFPRGVTDDYLHFPYPYLVEVPGFEQVRVTQLAEPDGKRLTTPEPLSGEERAKNLAMLKFIAAETDARGLDFQLGIWTHAYAWTDSPDAYHRVDGLTPETHARYCREALALILKECPEIKGLTMRVHGESGIPEGSYDFWRTVFEAIKGAGRTIEIDMHAKGVDEKMIEIAVATGMPVKLGAKYSAEHQGLGYQQADIRALEIPDGNLSKSDAENFSLSSGSRKFTRYGYADFLRADAKFKLWFRLWPGTQRHLLCVDPETIAGYARTARFCGAGGLDLMEPLSFKGREGSGHAGGRCAYADASLNPRFDWEKYDLYYRVWGRKLYNPDAEPEVWRRALRTELGAYSDAAETALAHASRILALMTSAHLDSASNHDLWYEMPENMPLVEGSEPSPYGDTPVPKVFGTVSPLDPQMFSTVVEYAQELRSGKASAKYSPIDVARWVDALVDAAGGALEGAQKNASRLPALRRIEEDVLIQMGLGRYFAHKLRSAVLLEIFRASHDPAAGKAAVEHFEKARAAWVEMAARANRVYSADVSYGRIPMRRGHWSDRVAGIEKDLAALRALVAENPAETVTGRGLTPAESAVLSATPLPALQLTWKHTPPERFTPGAAMRLTGEVQHGAAPPAQPVRLMYRHVNQGERWRLVDASQAGGGFEAEIPAEYTQSEFALEYYFEVVDGQGGRRMIPGFNATLSNQPYFAVYLRDGTN